MARPLSTAARACMLETAQGLAVEHGLDGVTIDEVARRSGVAKTTIYRHFENADDVALAAVREMIEAIVPPDTGSFRGDMEAVVDRFSETVRHPGFHRMFASMLSRALDDPRFADLYSDAQQVRRGAIRIAVQRGMARGEIDPSIDIEQAVSFTQGPFVAKRLVDQQEVSDSDVQVFLDLICRGLHP